METLSTIHCRAADWNLQEPSWTGRMRLVSQGDNITIKLEDKITGELFAKCPIEQYPGIAIETVTDSSRYFVLRIQDDNGRSAFIGVGFLDRSDSFDLNVALQDHFKWLKNREQIEKEKEKPKQELDLRFKEGETIKINMKITVSVFYYAFVSLFLVLTLLHFIVQIMYTYIQNIISICNLLIFLSFQTILVFLSTQCNFRVKKIFFACVCYLEKRWY